MNKINEKEYLWYEKYRPQLVEDLVIPTDLKNMLKKYVENEEIPNMGLFSENPGTGKTSTCNALVKELECESLFINASLETGIDTLRGKIANFASQCSMDGLTKIVVLDEADHFSKDGQAAFRAFIEEFSKNCRFIFTGNFKDKMLEPLLDRLITLDFNEFSKDEMKKPILQRLMFILKNEGIEYNPADLVPIINTYYPSVRSMVGALQKFSTTGKLIVNANELDSIGSFDKIFELIKAKKYNVMITEINDINAPSSFYTYMYKNISLLPNEKKPGVIMTIAKYQNMDSNVRDKNLNMAACCTELINLV